MLSAPLNCIPKNHPPLTTWLHYQPGFLILSHLIVSEDVWNITHWPKDMFHWNNVYSLVTFSQLHFSNHLCVRIVIIINTSSNNMTFLINYSWENIIGCVVINLSKGGKTRSFKLNKTQDQPCIYCLFHTATVGEMKNTPVILLLTIVIWMRMI